MSTSANPTTSPVKPSPTAKVKPNRLPAPTLFVGPPSRNASNLSISRTATHDSTFKPTRDPLTRTKSALRQPFHPISDASAAKDPHLGGPDTSLPPPDPSSSSSLSNSHLQPHPGPSSHHPAGSQPAAVARKASERSVDTKWRELQNTLNEVELTAQSTTHVFGDRHAAALTELRRAQVELARAWGRGSREEQQQNAADKAAGENRAGTAGSSSAVFGGGELRALAGADELVLDRGKVRRGRAATDASASTALSDESSVSTVGGGSGSGAGGGSSARAARVRGSLLEDETATDVRLASERRAANEAYFRQVDEGVKEVVMKLEAVAAAMKGMEGETRSLWESTTGENSPTGETEGAGE